MSGPAERAAERAGAGLKLVCWGVRGSVPAPGPATARYGGNTPCAELRAGDGRRLILDAGTGMRALGAAWVPDGDGGGNGRAGEVDVLVSHAHGDHLHGLGFFAPLAAGRARVTLHAAAALAAEVERGARAMLGPPLFPAIDGLMGRVQVRALAAGRDTTVAGFVVRPIQAAHPGGAAGFRVRDPASGRTLVYLPDNELAAIEGECGGRRALLEAVAGADLLVHDATYLPAELARHRGWGHSSYAEAVRLAADAGVGRLLLHHHHPARDDAAVDRLLRVARALGEASRPAVRVDAAEEGVGVAV